MTDATIVVTPPKISILGHELMDLARHLHKKHGCTVYFHIPEAFTVDRDSLRFSHIHAHHNSHGTFHIPIYTFNNKIYIHTIPFATLGSGVLFGPASASGAHLYPMEE